MASQTRAQRRARREARREEQAGSPPRRPELPTANGGGGGGRPERRPEPRAGGGFALFRFARESWGELQKVDWPTQNQLVQGTVVVLVACIIVGIYLWLCDEAFRRLVQQVFL